MAGFSLKFKTKTGQQHIVSNLEQNTTVRVLKNRIIELTNLPEDTLQVVLGFPPFKQLDFNKDDDLISAIGISNGDTLIVQEKQISEEERNQLAAKKRLEEDENLAKELAAQSEGNSGILLKQIVPSDNSCLFTSIGKSFAVFC